jgi:hypothetical protein
MPLSQEEAYQKVLEIYEKIDLNSQDYGYLVNWYEGVSWHYGINLKENGSPEQRVIIRTYHEKQAKKRFRILSKFINP